jgi:hypothetical protein
MKFIKIFSVLILVNFGQNAIGQTKLVVFERVAKTYSGIGGPLYISTKFIKIGLDSLHVAEVKRMKADTSVTKEKVDDYIRLCLRHTLVVTNNKTFDAIKNFTLKHKRYFMNEFKWESGDIETMSVTFNNSKGSTLMPDAVGEYLSGLIHYLSKLNCDKKAIEELKNTYGGQLHRLYIPD